jgi:prepilin-type N-terminal cleavage/methylation domain-containing protein
MLLTQLKKWFTLVELMIVIAIIGILAAGLIPAVTGYLARWRDSNRVFEMKQINNAIVQSQVGNRTFKVTGLSGSGQWWLNATNPTETITIVKALENRWFLKNGIPDIATIDINTFPVTSNTALCATNSPFSRELYMYFFNDNTGKYSISGYMENQLQPNIDNMMLSYNSWTTCGVYARNYALWIN